MRTSRWLLQLQLVPEQETEPPGFQLWLRNLDEPAQMVPICVQTLDELLAVLMNSAQRQAAPAPATLPPTP